MKKLTSLALAATLCLTLAACSNTGEVTPAVPNPPEPQNTNTTQVVAPLSTTAATTIAEPTPTNATTTIAEPTPTTAPATTAATFYTAPDTRNTPTESRTACITCCGVEGSRVPTSFGGTATYRFCSLDRFRTFVNGNEFASLTDGLYEISAIKVPRNVLPSFEIESITFAVGGSMTLDFVASGNYDCCPSSVVGCGCRALFRVMSFEGYSYFADDSIKQLERWGLKRLNHADFEVFHLAFESDGKIHHTFEYILNGQRIAATLPAIEGLSEYDMLRYLELVKVG